MQKPIIYLMVALLVIVATLIAILRVLDVVTTDQALDLGLKLGAILAIGLVASLTVGMLGRGKNTK